ncbi:DUF1254 domain-containing protein [Namhaeicola litoreus]|uniref:DUF1254 domain-containing protein n=1 Tax=Namhaeicola litoreus TaxID=1052145 RepID=A0ABW3XZ72_9FLAO
MKPKTMLLMVALAVLSLAACKQNQAKKTDDSLTNLPLDSIKAITKDAYIYAYPMIDMYRIQYAYSIDTSNAEYKAPWNQLKNMPKVFTPDDKAVQTPNSDTPYSMVGLDLRTEPMVLTIPKIEGNRYFSVQLINSYTNNFDYIGSRTTGNEGGVFMVAGPNWKGETPNGVTKVFPSETELVLAVYRTQLFDPSDLDKVIEIQKNYVVQPLSSYLGEAAPAAAKEINFIQPLSQEEQKVSLEVFNILNFLLQFCPTDPSEKELMNRFAKIGIGAGKTMDFNALSPEVKKAMEEGIHDAWSVDFAQFMKKVETGEIMSGKLFGTREYLKNNYLYRMGGAVLGIFGNSEHEAIYPMYSTDKNGQPLDGTSNNYTLHFAANELPPVNAFWSLTMYELPSSLLVSNPINRYLLNSPMLPDFKYDKDGGLTFYIQNASPGKDKESNWLPAPKGPFRVVLRLYWPKDAAIDGTWKNPPIKLVK